MTNREVYAAWGTFPPSGLLLIGQHGCGKSLLAEALATRARSAFLRVEVPRLALEIVHHGGKVGELVEAFSSVLGELPPTTVYFHELEFMQAAEIGGDRTDLPLGPIMDFLCELTDRAAAQPSVLLVGSTSHPGTLRPAFALPGALRARGRGDAELSRRHRRGAAHPCACRREARGPQPVRRGRAGSTS